MNFLRRQFGDVTDEMVSDTRGKLEKELHVIQGPAVRAAVIMDEAKAGMVGA